MLYLIEFENKPVDLCLSSVRSTEKQHIFTMIVFQDINSGVLLSLRSRRYYHTELKNGLKPVAKQFSVQKQ